MKREQGKSAIQRRHYEGTSLLSASWFLSQLHLQHVVALTGGGRCIAWHGASRHATRGCSNRERCDVLADRPVDAHGSSGGCRRRHRSREVERTRGLGRGRRTDG
eukprot:361740-Chlamydomonas_euryale.AAC.2